MNSNRFKTPMMMALVAASTAAMVHDKPVDDRITGTPTALPKEQQIDEGAFKIKWDQAAAKSRPSENRPETEYVRGTIYAANDEDFEYLVGKRAIVWCEGDIEPEQFLNKLQSVLCDIRDEVQVAGSTQTSFVLANIQVEREIEGAEAKADSKAIMKAQSKNLKERGTRTVVRNAGTGNVTAQQEAGAILKDALGADAHTGREVAKAILDAPNLTDEQALAAGGAIMAASTGMALAARPNAGSGLPNPLSNTIGTEMHAGDSVVGGVEHEGQTPYRRQEGVEHKPVAVQPAFGVVGGADVAEAPGKELSPNPNAQPGEPLTPADPAQGQERAF